VIDEIVRQRGFEYFPRPRRMGLSAPIRRLPRRKYDGQAIAILQRDINAGSLASLDLLPARESPADDPRSD
jgi:hypothetical protein